MILRIRHNNNTPRTIVTTAFVVIGLAFGVWSYLQLQRPADAADLRNFDPSNIMSDSVMSNKNSMTEAQIQTFLESKNPCNNTNISKASQYHKVKDGRFVCMFEDTFDGESAAHIIWQAAQDYSINPQVIIVLLQKEQGLITDTWPNSIQYRSATGYGCPDTAACDTQYYGLKNQIRQAANLFRNVLNGGWSNYPVGENYIQYHPDRNRCGGSTINIKNRATSALYRYTPYQPNQSALNAGYGTGDSCGAYGNRNFWLYFTDWFGDPTSGIYLDITKATGEINTLYSQQKLQMGSPSGTVKLEYDAAPRVWQSYDKGVVIWTIEYGARFVPYSSTYQRWQELGGSVGRLGVPSSLAIREDSDGRIWQQFKNGLVIYTQDAGGWEIVPGPIGDKWYSTGGSLGPLKQPISTVTVTNSGNRQQLFKNGIVVRQDANSPAHTIVGNVYEAWLNYRQEVGIPTTDTVVEPSGHTWQSFDKGLIVQAPNGSAWPILYGNFYTKWQSLGGSFGVLGRPTSNQTSEEDGRSWQFYEKGLVVRKSENSSPHEILFGPIYDRWQQIGGSTGLLGVPQGTYGTADDGRSWQYFENGVIIHSHTTGAWEIEGNFYGYWQEQGGSLGRLGKPIGQKYINGDNSRSQSFEKGKVVWRPTSGWSVE